MQRRWARLLYSVTLSASRLADATCFFVLAHGLPKNRQHKTQLTFWFGEQDNPQSKQMFYRHATATRRSTQDRLLLQMACSVRVNWAATSCWLTQIAAGWDECCAEATARLILQLEICHCSLQLCRNAISGTRARSPLLLLGLRHVPNQLAQELHRSCRTAALR